MVGISQHLYLAFGDESLSENRDEATLLTPLNDTYCSWFTTCPLFNFVDPVQLHHRGGNYQARPVTKRAGHRNRLYRFSESHFITDQKAPLFLYCGQNPFSLEGVQRLSQAVGYLVDQFLRIHQRTEWRSNALDPSMRLACTGRGGQPHLAALALTLKQSHARDGTISDRMFDGRPRNSPKH